MARLPWAGQGDKAGAREFSLAAGPGAAAAGAGVHQPRRGDWLS